MNCQTAEEEIQKSLDRTLTPQERGHLDTHLETCASCRSAWSEHRRLSRAAGLWARPTAQDDPGEAFNASVLSRLAARPQTQSAPIWLPLSVTLGIFTLFAWLPGLYGAGGEVIGAAARQTPAWLWANLHGFSWDAFASSAASLTAFHLPSWTWSVLLAIGVINGAFCLQARWRALR